MISNQSYLSSLCSHFTCFCAEGQLNIHPKCHPQQRQASLLGMSYSPWTTQAWVHKHTHNAESGKHASAVWGKTAVTGLSQYTSWIHRRNDNLFCLSQNDGKQLTPPALKKMKHQLQCMQYEETLCSDSLRLKMGWKKVGNIFVLQKELIIIHSS